jgi:hypothetical protein
MYRCQGHNWRRLSGTRNTEYRDSEQDVDQTKMSGSPESRAIRQPVPFLMLTLPAWEISLGHTDWLSFDMSVTS